MSAGPKNAEHGQLIRVLREKVADLVQAHPEKAAIILTGWLNQKLSAQPKKKAV